MVRRATYSGWWTTCVVGVLAMTTGCFNQTNLPQTMTVELPDGTTVEVEQGSGAVILADSAWEFVDDQGTAFVTVRFGPNGELASFENYMLAEDFLGSDIVFDGTRVPAAMTGLEYAAATFGAATTTGNGFAFEGVLNVFAPPLGRVATGEASATGMLGETDPDQMTGTFTFDFNVLVPIELPIPPEQLSGEFPFTARRVP